MEKIRNREKFLNELKYFVEKVQITEDFLKKLGGHQYFAEDMKNIEVSHSNYIKF